MKGIDRVHAEEESRAAGRALLRREARARVVLLQSVVVLLLVLLPVCLATAQEVSLQSYNCPDLYVWHCSFPGELTEIKTELDRKDATFRIVRGRRDSRSVSLESVNHLNHYLVVQDGRLVVKKRQAGSQFRRAATSKKVTGLKQRTWVSFESLHRPGHYIGHRCFSRFELTSGFLGGER